MDETLRISVNKASQEVVLMRCDKKNPDVILSSFVISARDAEILIEGMLDLPDIIHKCVEKLEKDGFCSRSHGLIDPIP